MVDALQEILQYGFEFKTLSLNILIGILCIAIWLLRKFIKHKLRLGYSYAFVNCTQMPNTNGVEISFVFSNAAFHTIDSIVRIFSSLWYWFTQNEQTEWFVYNCTYKMCLFGVWLQLSNTLRTHTHTHTQHYAHINIRISSSMLRFQFN